MSAPSREAEPLLDIDPRPAEGTVLTPPLPLHFLDWGGDGPAVVFLHGAGLTAHTWDQVCIRLRPRFRCIALDLRGHGDSGWSDDDDYALGSYASDVARLRDALGLDRVVLVGMSLGGVVAVTYAGSDVALDGLVIVEAGPAPRDDGRRRIRDFMTAPSELDSVEAFVDRAIAFNPLRRRDVLRQSLRHNLRQTPSGTWTWKYDPRQMAPDRVNERVRNLPRTWAAVADVACPTLVVRGGDSDVFHDEDAKRLAASFANGRWVRIDGARHTVQGDRPHALAAELDPFLKEVIGR